MPKNIRLNSTHCFTIKIPKNVSFNKLHLINHQILTFKDFVNLYQNNLPINLYQSLQKPHNPLRFGKNLLERI